MFRAILVILVCLAVTLMPSYAAIQCAGTCETEIAHEDTACCDGAPGVASAAGDHRDTGPSHHSHHCAAPCCGYVAHLPTAAAFAMNAEPLAHLLAMAATQHDSPAHDALFHPPRA